MTIHAVGNSDRVVTHAIGGLQENGRVKHLPLLRATGPPEILQPFRSAADKLNGCRFVTNGINHSATQMFLLASFQQNEHLGGADVRCCTRASEPGDRADDVSVPKPYRQRAVQTRLHLSIGSAQHDAHVGAGNLIAFALKLNRVVAGQLTRLAQAPCGRQIAYLCQRAMRIGGVVRHSPQMLVPPGNELLFRLACSICFAPATRSPFTRRSCAV